MLIDLLTMGTSSVNQLSRSNTLRLREQTFMSNLSKSNGVNSSPCVASRLEQSWDRYENSILKCFVTWEGVTCNLTLPSN